LICRIFSNEVLSLTRNDHAQAGLQHFTGMFSADTTETAKEMFCALLLMAALEIKASLN
jgi:hypothetical protein